MSRRPSVTTQTTFGVRLREARTRVGIAQDRLGVLAGLDELSSSARISRYETGVHQPEEKFARRLGNCWAYRWPICTVMTTLLQSSCFVLTR